MKKIKNTEIDPAVLGSNGSLVITNQDGYNYLDTLKDSQGRYLLTEDVTAVSGKALSGLPVVVVSNAVLPDVTSQFPVFIGNLPQAIAVFRRQNIVTNWEQFDSIHKGSPLFTEVTTSLSIKMLCNMLCWVLASN